MFGKVFSSMYDGTLATRGPWQALVTFQQFIVLADKTGIVDITPEAISRRTTIPLDIINIGIAALEQADTESRSPDLGGRRIARLSPDRAWGWQIVNYEKYRKIRSEDERREYMRELMRTRRAKGNESVSDGKHVLAKLAHAEAEAKGIKTTTPRAAAPRRVALPPDFTLDEKTLKWCQRRNMAIEEVQARFDYFRDYAKATGKTYADWQAAFKNSVRGDWAKLPNSITQAGKLAI